MEEQQTKVSPKFSFGMADWNEWDEDCKKNYGDCRSLKAMAEHNFHKNFLNGTFMVYHDLVSRVESLENELYKEKEKVTVKKNPYGTLGGGDEQDE